MNQRLKTPRSRRPSCGKRPARNLRQRPFECLKSSMPEVIQFTADMTLWWPCRRGDLLLWFRYDNPIGAKNGLQCYDSWQMRDGSHVRITNRLEDFPSWFQLHPLEISGRL